MAAVRVSMTSSTYSLIGATRSRSSSWVLRASSNSSRSASVVPGGWNIAATSLDRRVPSSRARAKSHRSSGELCGSTTVVIPNSAAMSRLRTSRAYCPSLEWEGSTRSSAARPARESPITAKPVMKPVGSPVSGSASTSPNGTRATPREMPNRSRAGRFIHAECPS